MDNLPCEFLGPNSLQFVTCDASASYMWTYGSQDFIPATNTCPQFDIITMNLLKRPKPTPLMDSFFKNIEYFEDRVVVQEKVEMKTSTSVTPPVNAEKSVWKWRGMCVVGTSSNFSKHAKKHSTEYQKYDRTHPKQMLITSSIVKNLVVGCGVPHYVVENPNFRAFMKDVDSMWDPTSGKWIANRSPKMPARY